MKKVLVINTVPYSIGGISTVIENYFVALDKNRFRLDFVVNKYIDKKYEHTFLSAGSQIFRLNRNSVLRYVGSVASIIRKNKYDVVHIHGNSRTMTLDLLAAWLGGAPFRIAHSHNDSCNHPLIHRFFKIPFDLLCNGRIACGKAAGEWLFSKKEYAVLPNAVDTGRYVFDERVRCQMREKLGLADGEILLGHVGYFNEQKNQAFILDILAALLNQGKNVKVLFVGEGPLKKSIEEKASLMGVSSKAIFWGESENVPDLMCAMDVFVFPSKWEGFGIAMLEAQFMGLPCIASDEVPLETDVVDGNVRMGLQQPVKAWAEAVSGLLTEPRDRSHIRLASERYDIKKQVKLLESIYESGTR